MVMDEEPLPVSLQVHIPTTDVWRVLAPALIPGIGTPLSGVELVAAILNVFAGDEQGEIIKRMARQADRQIKKHMGAGRDHLSDALEKDIPASRKQALLEEALKQFVLARNVEAPPENIRAMTYVAVCYECLGDETLATKWLTRAYSAAAKRRQELLTTLAQLSKQTSIIYPAALMLSSVVIPLLAYAAWNQMATQRFWVGYAEVFDLERQMIQLSAFLAKKGVERKPVLYFPEDVVSIQKWQVAVGRENTGTPALFAFNELHRVVSCLHLTDGKTLSEKDVTGIFPRQGQVFSALWRTKT